MLFHRCIFRSYIRVYIRIASQGSISGHFPARYRHAQPPTHNWHIHFRIRLDTGTGEMQNASCLEKLSRPPWKFIRPPIDGRSSSIEAIQFIPFITLRSFFRPLFPIFLRSFRVQRATLWINDRSSVRGTKAGWKFSGDNVMGARGGGTIDKIRVGNNYRAGQDQLIKIPERFRSVSIRQTREQYITRHKSRSSPRSSPIRSI